MDVGSRRARVWAPVGELVLISVLLLPWTRAYSSSGGTWSWNVLGQPLVPGTPGMVIWATTAAVVCGTTWFLLHRRVRRSETG